MQDIIIRKAKKEDLKPYHDIITEVCNWFKKNNIDQWDENYPKIFNLEYFNKELNENEIFVALKDNEIVGGMLLRSSDIYYSRCGNAYYIHHLASKINVLNVGSALIDYAFKYSKYNNKDYLRLDCISTNKKLNDYYLEKGFKYTDTRLKKGKSYNLYEKEVKK